MSKKSYGIGRILLIAFIIGILSTIFDYAYHLIIFETLQGQPHSPTPYWIVKFFTGFIISFVFLLLFKKLNIWIKSIIIGISSALIFAFVLKIFYSSIYGAPIYGYSIHLAHSIAVSLATYLTLKIGGKDG